MMKRTKSFGLTVLFLIASFTPAYAEDRDVPGEYSTIQAAVDTPGSYDRIVVHYKVEGSYSENVVVNVSNIKIMGAEGEPRPICQGQPDGELIEQNAFTINAPDVTLEGLEVAYSPNSCIQINPGADGAIIDDCHVYHWEAVSNNIDDEIGGGIVVLANNVTITNSTIDGAWGFEYTPFLGVVFKGVSAGTFGPNNTVASIAGTQLSASVCLYSPDAEPGTVEIFDNTITDCYSGIYFHNNYAPSNLEFRACNNEVIMSGSGGRGLQVSCIDDTSENTVVFEKNTVWSRDRTVRGTYGVKAYNINITDFERNTITFQNNFIYDVYTGFDTQMGGGDGGHGIRAYNNTVYNFYFRGVDLRPPQADPSTHWKIKNNIIYSTTTDACGIYVPKRGKTGANEGFESDFNYLYVPNGIVGDWTGTVCPTLGDWQAASEGDYSSINANPLSVFEDAPHIGMNSPCVGVGDPTDLVSDDIDGETRTPGECDIGADEFSGDIPPTVDITSPNDGDTFDSGVPIFFEGTTDPPSASLIWTSNLDGEIGTGSGFSATLSDGNHVITASATDGGATGSDFIIIGVGVIVKVEDILPDPQAKGKGGKVKLLITVIVVDGSDQFVDNANVYLTLEAPDGTFMDNGPTGPGGTVTFEKPGNAPDGDYVATVTDIDKPGYKFDPSDNTMEFTISGGSSSTQLLQNYENPFNPETWIPFKLGKAEHVVIRIHDMTGRLVRTLELGEKAPGAYISKEEAAYWDGKNEAGEYVSSGLYFYTIQAGDFTATKKMLIAR